MGSFSFETLKWLYAPEKTALLFLLRTIIASYIALAIALWMEMDSPRWAIMAVWVVSQNSSRGEILSKAYWVIFGNILGMFAVLCIAASFPQQPLLFELTVAAWVAICCWFASCTRNFVSFGWSMAGFSCAIVLFASSHDLNTVFMMTMSRGSYFILGILSENFVARLFDLNLQSLSHKKLNTELKTVVEGMVVAVTRMMKQENWTATASDQVISSITTLSNTIEFRENELRGIGYTGDHARATLSQVSSVLAKSMGFSIQLKNIYHQSLSFDKILPAVEKCLQQLLEALKKDQDLKPILNSINQLRWECRQRIADSFYSQLEKTTLTDHQYAEYALNNRILYQALREILAEIGVVLQELQKSQNLQLRDNFKFEFKFKPDYKHAARNTVRAFITITVGCMLWELTGWHNATVFLSFLCMGCSRFCVMDNISAACVGWFKGICCAILVAGFFNFVIMPMISNFEILCLVLFFPLGIGALAMCVPKYSAIAAGYMFFFCYLVGFTNSGRVDEVSFLNDAEALFMSGLVALLSYQIIFPYHRRRLRRQLRQQLLDGLHHLARDKTIQPARQWIDYVSSSFVLLMRKLSEDKNTTLVQTYRRGSIAVMLIGIHVIRLRIMVRNDVMTKDIKDILRVVLRRIAQYQASKASYGQYARTVIIAHRAIEKLRKREAIEKNLAIRVEISVSISSLILIAYALDKDSSFLKVKSQNMIFY